MVIGLVLSTGSLLHAGALTSEVAGIRVELTSRPSEPTTKAETEYVARLADQAGAPVTGARVTLRGGMADGMNVVTPLRAAEPVGVYRGRVLFTMEGTWRLTLRVARESARFELTLTERVRR